MDSEGILNRRVKRVPQKNCRGKKDLEKELEQEKIGRKL